MNEQFPKDRTNNKPMKNAQLLSIRTAGQYTIVRIHPAPVRMAARRGSPAFNPSTQEVESRQEYIPGPSTNAF